MIIIFSGANIHLNKDVVSTTAFEITYVMILCGLHAGAIDNLILQKLSAIVL